MFHDNSHSIWLSRTNGCSKEATDSVVMFSVYNKANNKIIVRNK